MSLASEFRNKALYPIILAATMFSHNAFAQSVEKDNAPSKGKIVLNEFPKVDVAYRYDTLDLFGTIQRINSAAYYDYKAKNITVNIFAGELAQRNSFNSSTSTIAHEYKHLLDDTTMNMSLEQQYKTYCNMEIGANIAELLQLRDDYIHSDSSGQQKIRESVKKFDYYFDAIDRGEINPFSTTSADFKKELRFIGKETKEMWMQQFAQHYDKQHTTNIIYFLGTHDYEQLKDNNEAYKKAQDKIFTIGGINFGDFFDDISITDINPDIIKADKMIALDKSREAVGITLENDRAVLGLQDTYNEVMARKLFGDVNTIRKAYMQCEKDSERAFVARSANSEIAKAWIFAVQHGEFTPENEMNEKEQNWLAEKISTETGNCQETPNMELLFSYYVQTGHDVIYASQNSTSPRANYFDLLTQITTIGGKDFSSYANFPQNKHLRELDKKIREDEHLKAEDFTYGQTHQTINYIKRNADLLEKQDIHPEASIAPYMALQNVDTTWSPDHRISETRYREVLDLGSPFLHKEIKKREQLEQNEIQKRVNTVRNKLPQAHVNNNQTNTVSRALNNQSISQSQIEY